MSLEDIIRKAMLTEGVCALNLFLNPNGEFQANTGRGSGGYTISRNADPVKAILGAFKTAEKHKPEPTGFEDVL